MSEQRILAVVNDKEITDLQVETFIRNLGPQKGQQFDSEEGREKILHELIQQELLYADAIDNRYDEEEEFLDRLDKTEEEMLKQYAMFKLLTQVEVTEQELSDYYRDNKNNFFREESIQASHILVDTEEKANEVLEQLNKGTAFENAAMQYSSCPSSQQGGDLGPFTKGRMVKEFEDAAFALQLGEISEPVKTQFGYHIIKVTDKKEPGIMLFEEVKEQLRRDLLAAKQNFFYSKKIEDLKGKYKVEIKALENN
jgi:peptidyl-prolyl cis-trans isomerase C